MGMAETDLDALRANAVAASAALADAEAQASTPALTAKAAKSQLAAAEANLKAVEAPHWELEHATVALNQARRELDAADGPDLKAVYEKRLSAAQARFDAASAAEQPTARQMDVAAQAVLDARAALAKAEEA